MADANPGTVSVVAGGEESSYVELPILGGVSGSVAPLQ
jgi:hypothetical protein